MRNPILQRAAAMMWAEFRAYIIDIGEDYDEAYASIRAGEKGMGDYCDDNFVIADAIFAAGLTRENYPSADDEEAAKVWNEAVGEAYRHTRWGQPIIGRAFAEFPEIILPAWATEYGFEDRSFRHDVTARAECVVSDTESLILWVADPDPAQREHPDMRRFWLDLYVDGDYKKTLYEAETDEDMASWLAANPARTLLAG